jgi:ankyrin repeat protein
MEITDKDVYELIVHSSDDRSVLEMLSVNKKFNNDESFYRVLLKRYPYLIKFRKEGEKWKTLYLRMIYYIDKLNELEFPYINYKKFNPDREYKRLSVYKNAGKIERIWGIGLLNAVRANRLDLVKYFLNKGAKNISYAYRTAVIFHNLDFMKFFESLDENIRGNIDYNKALVSAALNNHMDLLKFLINERGATNYNEALTFSRNLNIIDYLINEKGANNFNEALRYAPQKENWLELADYYIEKGANNFNDALNFASYIGNLEMIKYLINKGANSFYEALINAVLHEKMEVMKYLIEEMNKRNIQLNLRYLLRYDITQNKRENLEIIKYFIETYPGLFDISKLKQIAIEKGKNNVYNYLQTK